MVMFPFLKPGGAGLLILLLSTPMFGQSLNWARDIAPILYENCTICHHSGGLAPFSLVGYENTFQHRSAVENAVITGKMPPWPPDPDYVELAHARVLEPSEIESIENWVAAGAPQGEPAAAPPPPVYEQEEVITQPDLVLPIPEYVSQAEGQDIYRCFPLATGLDRDWTIKGLECVPGNPEIVHHVLIFMDESDLAFQLDAVDPGPGYTSFGGVGSSSAKLIGAWAPGGQPFFFPEGMGRRLPTGVNIILQIHYPAGTKGKTDQTKINFQLSPDPAREVLFEPVINHVESLTNGPLYIPANTIKTFNAQFFVPIDVTIIAVAPHMHLLGQQIQSFALNLQRDTLPLIKIDDWDFHWQTFYRYPRPVILRKSSTIYAKATYDNTRNNHENPNDPPQNVRVGEATTDEMFIIYAAFLLYEEGDEEIILVNTDVNTSVGQTPNPTIIPLQVYPNPTPGSVNLQFDLPQMQRLSIDLFDGAGRKVKTLHQGDFSSDRQYLSLNLAGQAAGAYYLRLNASAYYGVVRVVVH